MKEDAGARHTTWRYELAAAARVAMNEAGLTTPLRGPIDITLVFMLHRPASHYGSGKNSERLVPSAPILPAKVPDVDKLTRAVFDSMTSIVWVDDSQVVKLLAYKVFVHKWEEEGVSVKVGVIEQTEEGE
jgi:crossover junction endodeoxyribonuclease RusA